MTFFYIFTLKSRFMKRLLLLLITIPTLHIAAQSVNTNRAELLKLFAAQPECAGSVYRAYPTPPKADLRVPQGYEVAYISHYGRHGSRWLTEDSRYKAIIEVFSHNELTPAGKRAFAMIQEAWRDAEERSGELTAVGERQHKAIGRRMVERFPTLFAGKRRIKAESSIVRRCMMSMMAFCESVKECNPNLEIERSANQRGMKYINYESSELKEINRADSHWRKVYNNFRANAIDTLGIMSTFFAHPRQLSCSQLWLAEELYWLAQDIQNTELSPTDVNLLQFFTAEQLYNIWKCVNLRMYIANSNSPLSRGLPAESSENLLQEIISSADDALSGRSPYTANLRFGHDSALLRLLARMHIVGCSEPIDDNHDVCNRWQDYRISPMAANLQIVFYVNPKSHSTIVRFLLNERKAFLPIPSIKGYDDLYEWEEVKKFWEKSLSNIKI